VYLPHTPYLAQFRLIFQRNNADGRLTWSQRNHTGSFEKNIMAESLKMIFFITIFVGVLSTVQGWHSSSAARISAISRTRLAAIGTTFENDIQPSPLPSGATKSSNNLEERRPLKVALLALSARTSRGEIATELEKDRARDLICGLEGFNPTTDPALSDLCLGKWELVFASTQLFRSSPFFMAARAVCKEGREAASFNQFCDLHRDALAFTQIGKVVQIVTEDKLISEFETKVAVLPGAPVIVRGTIVSESDIVGRTAESWELYMDKIKIKGSNLPLAGSFFETFGGLPIRTLGEQLEQRSGPRPRPIFRTYYVDKHMRISRDQDDNFFVYNRIE
jgi:hypothetical protein